GRQRRPIAGEPARHERGEGLLGSGKIGRGAGARHARLDARKARKVQVRLRRIADSRTLLGYLRDSIEQLEALVGEIRRIACGPVRAERRQHFDGKVATGQSDALCALADVTVRDSRSSRSTACEIE